MKSPKVWALLDFIPERPLYRQSFVRYYINGITFYDHRRKVKASINKGYEDFQKYFKRRAVVQLVVKKNNRFVNIFDDDQVTAKGDLNFYTTEISDEDISIEGIWTHKFSCDFIIQFDF